MAASRSGVAFSSLAGTVSSALSEFKLPPTVCDGQIFPNCKQTKSEANQLLWFEKSRVFDSMTAFWKCTGADSGLPGAPCWFLRGSWRSRPFLTLEPRIFRAQFSVRFLRSCDTRQVISESLEGEKRGYHRKYVFIPFGLVNDIFTMWGFLPSIPLDSA